MEDNTWHGGKTWEKIKRKDFYRVKVIFKRKFPLKKIFACDVNMWIATNCKIWDFFYKVSARAAVLTLWG